jgi:hypothetical protein
LWPWHAPDELLWHLFGPVLSGWAATSDDRDAATPAREKAFCADFWKNNEEKALCKIRTIRQCLLSLNLCLLQDRQLAAAEGIPDGANAFHAGSKDPNSIYFVAGFSTLLSHFSQQSSQYGLWQKTFDMGVVDVLLCATFTAVATKVDSVDHEPDLD